jgi:hypothetical protein
MIVSLELERIWKAVVLTCVNVLYGNVPEMTEEIQEMPQNSQCLGRDSNRVPSELEPEVIPLQLYCCVYTNRRQLNIRNVTLIGCVACEPYM